MSATGDREDEVRTLLEKWRVPHEHCQEAYKLLMDRYRLQDALFVRDNPSSLKSLIVRDEDVNGLLKKLDQFRNDLRDLLKNLR